MSSTPPPALAPAERELVDQLVPPAWSRSRRLAAVVATTVIVGTVGALWWAGVLGPNLGPVSGYGYGPLEGTVGTTDDGARRGTVELQLELTNRGRVAVEDLTVSAAGFGGGQLTQPGGPIDLPGRSRQQVTLHLEISDCRRFQAPPFVGLSATATSVGVLGATIRDLRVPGADHAEIPPSWPDAREPDVRSWWYAVAQPVCDPEAMFAP